MLYSKSSEYAIQAMIYLAENQSMNRIMVNKIAAEYDIPVYFLAKIVQTLSKHHLIRSFRGRNGGIQLNKPAKDIRIIDIVYAIDGPPPEVEMCVIGLDECSDSVACPLHNNWKIIKENIRVLLGHENLAILAEEVIKKKELLAQ
ncbi:MAG: Rrf2 family transcriptional regulator [Candidatus Marinimicrobia bacterium]|jgi:Rrf2 family protein|nr:Rrf2 family transcriptional regulator [Candidatus Neomarinimicrobiota bacterium]MBT3633833.1 Rrf2 family transcriptional regulator [Candidatus Neomarinimicrobiota bacterium]MBT3682625.1 Rrf2 family transcriptional regulator [Candidatus Neomarinimicrobiota bacterium]MBT3759389.1 Rrf2 family transcriptional regulator [Candidatus Neomarinimicrobiota bacterium]MBT3894603.1 Rrf2 family transcriptional regulator [Candidatus Neomarinimicrobiota bacterium]